MPTPTALSSTWIGTTEFRWRSRTFVMGILNVTPDSFSGDGVGYDLAAAVRRARQCAEEGADILDVGGESTRPAHLRVSEEEELRRVIPALRAVASEVTIPISIDTSRASVARAAVAAGAVLINDVSGLGEPPMGGAVHELGVPVVLMSSGAQRDGDVVSRVNADLDAALRRAEMAGIAAGQVILDPGFGFGKVAPENLELLRRLPEVRRHGVPMLVGLSRKSTIKSVLGAGGQHSSAANAALVALAIAGGADIVRVHDVAGGREAARIADAVLRPVAPITTADADGGRS